MVYKIDLLSLTFKQVGNIYKLFYKSSLAPSKNVKTHQSWQTMRLRLSNRFGMIVSQRHLSRFFGYFLRLLLGNTVRLFSATQAEDAREAWPELSYFLPVEMICNICFTNNYDLGFFWRFIYQQIINYNIFNQYLSELLVVYSTWNYAAYILNCSLCIQ